MKYKLNRIAAFIDSLPEESTLSDIQSVVLSTQLDLMGGDNGKNCINKELVQCYNGVNGGDCHNYYGYCEKAENGGSCANDPKPVLPNMLCGC